MGPSTWLGRGHLDARQEEGRGLRGVRGYAGGLPCAFSPVPSTPRTFLGLQAAFPVLSGPVSLGELASSWALVRYSEGGQEGVASEPRPAPSAQGGAHSPPLSRGSRAWHLKSQPPPCPALEPSAGSRSKSPQAAGQTEQQAQVSLQPVAPVQFLCTDPGEACGPAVTAASGVSLGPNLPLIQELCSPNLLEPRFPPLQNGACLRVLA